MNFSENGRFELDKEAWKLQKTLLFKWRSFIIYIIFK